MTARHPKSRKPLQAVVLDWAGTAVDHGCMGPVAVFVEVFKRFDVEVTVAEARQFMGLMKKDHIRSMLHLPRIKASWRKVHGTLPLERDVDALYRLTEPMMVETIANHAEPIPGALDAVEQFRGMGLKIGSCTGYTRPMMDVMVPEAARKGYTPDAIVTSSDVPRARPYPFMCYQNALMLDVYPMEAMVKIGDTLTDIQEGLNAGMWTIAVTNSGNELGLTHAEKSALSPKELEEKTNPIKASFLKAGAHYVVDDISQCPEICREINLSMASK